MSDQANSVWVDPDEASSSLVDSAAPLLPPDGLSDTDPVVPEGAGGSVWVDPGGLGPSEPTFDSFPGFGVKGPAIPGLEFSGGKLVGIPDRLPTSAPQELEDDPGRLSKGELNARLRVASARWSRSRDVGKRVEILGEFIREWDPDRAEALGFSEEGEPEPEGLMKLFAGIDLLGDRQARMAIKTLRDIQETEAAAYLAGEEGPSLKTKLEMLKTNWETSKGELAEGSDAIRDLSLWASTWGSPDSRYEAEQILEAREDWDAKEKELIGKAKYGELGLNLFGHILVSPLNLVGLPFRAAKGTKASALAESSGIKLTQAGRAYTNILESQARGQARRILVDDLEKSVEGLGAVPEEVGRLRLISEEMSSVEKQIDNLTNSTRVADDLSPEALGRLSEEVSVEIAKRDELSSQFDDAYNAIRELKGESRVSTEALFGGLDLRASQVAAKEIQNAVDLAFKAGVKTLVGGRIVEELSDAQALVREMFSEGDFLTQLNRVNSFWSDAARQAEESGQVLVSLGLKKSGGKIESTGPVFMSVGDAKVYENARAGLYGREAAVASYYPGTGVLEKTLGKDRFRSLSSKAVDSIILDDIGPTLYTAAGKAASVLAKGISGKSREAMAIKAGNLVKNIEPVTFALSYAIAKRFPQLDRVRRSASGVGGLRTKPAAYATQDAAGDWSPIKRELLLHPSMHHRMVAEERQRLTNQAMLRSEWPRFKAKLEAIAGDSPQILRVARQAYELGWANADNSMATADDLLRLASIERLRELVSTLSSLGDEVQVQRLGAVTKLSDEDVSAARAAIAELRRLEPAVVETAARIDVDAFDDLLDRYVDQSGAVLENLAAVEAQLATRGEKLLFLDSLRQKADFLDAATRASVESRLRHQTELAVGKIGQDFEAELGRISDELNKIDEQLSAVAKKDKPTTESSAINEALARLEGASEDELLQARDIHLNAYKETLDSFTSSLASGGVSNASAVQAYVESVSVAWKSGKEIPLSSLFEAVLDTSGRRYAIDATLVGAKSTRALGLPKGVSAKLTKLASLRRDYEIATIDQLITGASSAATDAAKAAYERAFEAASSDMVKTIFTPKKPKEDLVHPVGSPGREILESLQIHYKNRMASITAQVATRAAEIREESRQAILGLYDRLVKRGVVSEADEKDLEKAIALLSDALFGSRKTVSLPASKDLSADILLRKAINRARKEKNPALRAALLRKDIAGIRERLAKVGDEFDETDLGRALADLDTRRAKKKRMPTEEKDAFSKALKEEVDDFLKTLREREDDFRHPDDALRELESRLDSSYNILEAEGALFRARLEALRDADTLRFIGSLTGDQKARVSKLVKDPRIGNLVLNIPFATPDGVRRHIEGIEKKIASAESRLARMGEDVTEKVLLEQREVIRGYREQLRLLGDPEEFQQVIGVARLMKKFFDDHLASLKKAGAIDKDFDEVAFFARVDVGAYFPHMLSQSAIKRNAAFKGSGGERIGRALKSYFSENRKLSGLVDDINDRYKEVDAKRLVEHVAKTGGYGPEAAEAAARGKAAFREYLDATGSSYDELVAEMKQGPLLAEYDALFESDPIVVMEYYHRRASEAVADARFIETILDLFPQGRLISELPPAERARAAAELGFVPLGEVEHLQSVLKKMLPKGLQGLAKVLKERVLQGATLDEVRDLVRAEVGDVDDDIIRAMSSPDLKVPYVPIQVKEYLNWRNSSDAAFAKKSLGAEWWDSIQAWMKTQATIVALAHIGRNIVGNTISLVQEIGLGAVDPRNQFAAARIWGSWGDEALDSIVKIGDEELTVAEWRRFFSERGFFDEALSTDFSQDSVGAVMKEVQTSEATAKQVLSTGAGAVTGLALGSFLGMGAPLFFAGGAAGLAVGKRWSGVKAVRGGSSYKTFVKDSVEEIKKAPAEGIPKVANEATGAIVGGVIGSAAGPIGAAIGAHIGKKSIGDYIQMMSGLNRSAESQARLSMAVGLIRNGVPPEEALIRVNASLRDYSDLTPIEKNIFRRFFFFYTWEAGNMKYQLDFLRNRPRAVRTMSSITNGLYQMQFDEDELASLPEHYRYKVVVKSGVAKVIALSGLPHEPMLEVLTRRKEGYPMQGLATRVHPAILSFFEMTFGGGRSFYYGKPIDELNNINQLKHAPPLLKMVFGYPEEPNYYVPIYKDGVKTGRTREVRKSTSPVIFYLGQKLPGYRWMNQYMTIAADTFNGYAMESALTAEELEDARASDFEKFMMFNFGWRETAIDWDYQAYRASRDMEEEMLDMIQKEYPMAVGQRRYLRKKLSEEPGAPLAEEDDG
tara:strand:- start:8063 stop:14938 length:6876 start_codon:yes stop_codon:yes gene_type:complete